MSNARHLLPPSATSLARIAGLVTTAGLGVFAVVFAAAILVLAIRGEVVDPYLAEEFLPNGENASFPGYRRWLGFGLSLLPDMFGIFGLWQARKLFAGYRRGEVFTLAAAARLRLIGWAVVLLAPANMLTNIAGHALFAHWAAPGQLRIELAIESAEIFALVFGLLIVVVGHVMYQAIEISEENEAFV